MKQTTSPRIPIKTLVYASLSIAIVFVITRFLSIPVLSGYVNLGDGVILIASAFFGPTVGALAGSIGSALSDLSGGYLLFVPVTFAIKGLEGLVAGLMFKRRINKYLTIVVSLVIMVAGYFIAESLILSLVDKTFGFVYAVSELPFNIGQAVASGVLFLLVDIVKRIRK
jgi:uncharacterized membrane protein